MIPSFIVASLALIILAFLLLAFMGPALLSRVLYLWVGRNQLTRPPTDKDVEEAIRKVNAAKEGVKPPPSKS